MNMKATEQRKFAEQVETWRRDLVDLSRRNRLINMPLQGRGAVIQVLEPALPDVLDRLEKTAARGWKFFFAPDPFT